MIETVIAVAAGVVLGLTIQQIIVIPFIGFVGSIIEWKKNRDSRGS